MLHKTQAYYFNMSIAYIMIMHHLLNYTPIANNSLEDLQDEVSRVFQKMSFDNFTNKDEIIINDQEIIKIIITNTSELMLSITQEYPQNSDNNRSIINNISHYNSLYNSLYNREKLGVDHIINKKIINYYNMLNNIGAQIDLNLNPNNPCIKEKEHSRLETLLFYQSRVVINNYLKSIDQLIPKTVKLLLDIPIENIDNICNYQFDIINLMPTLNNLGPDLYNDQCPICIDLFKTCITQECHYFVNNYPENKISSLYDVCYDYKKRNIFLIKFFSSYKNIVNDNENKNNIKMLQKSYNLPSDKKYIKKYKTEKLNQDMLKIIFNFITFTHFEQYESFALCEHDPKYDNLNPYYKQKAIDSQKELFVNYYKLENPLEIDPLEHELRNDEI